MMKRIIIATTLVGGLAIAATAGLLSAKQTEAPISKVEAAYTVSQNLPETRVVDYSFEFSALGDWTADAPKPAAELKASQQ